jgi:hypothetical protein
MSTKRGLIAAMTLAALMVFAQAQQVEARLTKAESVEAKLLNLSTANPPDCCTPQPVCCPKPCVVYRHRGPKLCCDCKPPVPLTLSVKNPCTGCAVDVSVCIPACCSGEPKVCCAPGIFGREVVNYEWCCGYNVKVAFKPCGDVLVVTWGR